jgi:glycosyltransferase involved in cell wall biosynthesis
MKKGVCVLITSTFPAKGETFLRYEIEFLSRSFSRVDIISMAGQDMLAKPTPDMMLLEEFENVHFLGGLSNVKAAARLPSYSFMSEFIRELPMAARSGVSLAKHVYRTYSALRLVNFLESRYPDDGNHIFYAYWMNASAIGLSLMKHRHNHRVCRAHGSDVYDENIKTGFNSFQHLVARSLDRVFCISQNGFDYLARKLGSSTCLDISRLGVSIPTLSSAEKEDDKLHIVSCSVIDANKRVGLILDAVSHLPDLKIHWTHIGNGPLQADLESKSRSLPDGVKVDFIGFLDNAEVHSLYQSRHFDMFINSSASEGIPVAAMEAMSYGIPCLASDVGGTKELLQGGGGMVFDAATNSIELAQHIRDFSSYISTSHGEARRLARQRVVNAYNAEKNFRNFSEKLRTMSTEGS